MTFFGVTAPSIPGYTQNMEVFQKKNFKSCLNPVAVKFYIILHCCKILKTQETTWMFVDLFMAYHEAVCPQSNISFAQTWVTRAWNSHLWAKIVHDQHQMKELQRQTGCWKSGQVVTSTVIATNRVLKINTTDLSCPVRMTDKHSAYSLFEV